MLYPAMNTWWILCFPKQGLRELGAPQFSALDKIVTDYVYIIHTLPCRYSGTFYTLPGYQVQDRGDLRISAQ